METQEQTDTIRQANVRLDPPIFEILERMRIAEKRPMANMIAFLLETHPRVQPMLETEPATTGATA